MGIRASIFKKLILLIGLGMITMLLGCGVGAFLNTHRGAEQAFNKLPFTNSHLVAMKTGQSSDDSLDEKTCVAIIISAIYYTPKTFEDLLKEIEPQLFSANWQIPEGYSPNAHIYIQGEEMSLSIKPVVEIYNRTSDLYLPIEEYEFDSLENLPLLPNKPIDNNIDDGYFMVNLWYHPYPPNGCRG